MINKTIDTLFIFAAGLGTRMGELTFNRPKPLIKIADKPLLQYNLELALAYPFKKIIINTHYHADQIKNFVREFKNSYSNLNLPKIFTIYEPVLLETGGAIKNAVKKSGLPEAIFTMNSDMIIRSEENIFEHLQQSWQQKDMDFLLLLQDYKNAIGYKGNGDFDIALTGKLIRTEKTLHYEYIYAGVSIIKPDIIARDPDNIFSLGKYYRDNHMAYGIKLNHSKWYHASSMPDISEIEQSLVAGFR